VNLALAWHMLERARDLTGAETTCATFDTAHGIVALVATPDGRVMYVNGERVPMERAA